MRPLSASCCGRAACFSCNLDNDRTSFSIAHRRSPPIGGSAFGDIPVRVRSHQQLFLTLFLGYPGVACSQHLARDIQVR